MTTFVEKVVFKEFIGKTPKETIRKNTRTLTALPNKPNPSQTEAEALKQAMLEQTIVWLEDQTTVQRNGSKIFFYDKTNSLLLAQFNTFDNTVLICEQDGFEVADALGAKRFIIGNARKSLNDRIIIANKAQLFGRDRQFPMTGTAYDVALTYKTADLETLLSIKNDKNEIYGKLAEMFYRCANFTPGKQEEYKEGGEKENMYCRMNPKNNQDQTNSITDHAFLLDANNNIVGSISASIMITDDGKVDLYIYDEVVDYYTLLSEKEIDLLKQHGNALAELEAQLKKISTGMSDAEKLVSKELKDVKTRIAEMETMINAISKNPREKMLAELFTAARKQFKSTLKACFPEDTDSALAARINLAIIRVAAGREDSYEKCGCSKKNPGIYVIHGPRTNYGNELDAHVKAGAKKYLDAKPLPKIKNQSIFARVLPTPAVETPIKSSKLEMN